MKNRHGRPMTLAIAVFILVILSGAPAIAAHYRHAYEFQPPEITVLPNGRHIVRIADTRNNDEVAGAPILPLKTARLFVPADEEIVSVDVKTAQPTTLKGSYDIQFAVSAHPLSAVGPFPPDFPNPAIYQKDAFFPAGLHKKKGPQFLLGVQIAEVDLAPVQYNPVNGKIRYYSRMEVAVTTRRAAKSEKVVRYRGLRKDWQQILKTVDNRADFVAAEDAGALSDAAGGLTPEIPSTLELPTAEYLVITSQALAPTFQTLTDYRATPAGGGYTTHIEDIAAIDAAYTGVDLAERVRNYIRDMYSKGTRYVVLGGDTQIIPSRGCYATVGSYTDSGIPSDLYFGCLDGTWNEDGDALWGEVNDGIGGGEIDWFSEVFVGRISADDPAEAANHIHKIIAAETSQRPNRTLMVGEKLDDTPTWGGDRMDWVYSYMDGIPVAKLYDREGTWSKADLLNQINLSQYHWLNHLGHSNSTYNMKMGTGDVASMTNGDFFLLYSQGCYSGNIGYDDCFGEVLTNRYADRGAHAYIGNSRYGWYNSGSYVTGASNLMHKEFAEAVFSDQYTRLGEANQIPKATLHTGTYRWIAFELNLLGDPVFDLDPAYCSSDADCSDGLFCNGEETCSGNVCQEGSPVICDNGVFCDGQEECSEGQGKAVCISSGSPCPAGAECVESDQTCITCVEDEDCDDQNPCTVDVCVALDSGDRVCRHDAAICGEIEGCCPAGCNEAQDLDCPMACGDGYCHGREASGGGEDCTSCAADCAVPSGSCSACFKGVCDDVCWTKKETSACSDCAPTLCCGDGLCGAGETEENCPVDCGGQGCTDNSDCDDGLFCNGVESCEAGACRSGAAPCVDDGAFCNGVETCDEQDDICEQGPPPCDAAYCDESRDACNNPECSNDSDCNDNNECTLDRCTEGSCVNDWPGCGPDDGCCPEGCSDDPDCDPGSFCFKGQPDGKCNLAKEDVRCPDCW